MALVIPDLQSAPTFDAQAIPDATDWNAVALLDQFTGVVSGCQVTPQSSPDMTVGRAIGLIESLATYIDLAVTSSVTIAAASTSGSPSGDRKDIVVAESGSGDFAVIEGTPCGTAGWSHSTASPYSNPPPVKPALPSGYVLLGEIYVAADGDPNSGGGATTAIYADNIIDKTALLTPSVNAGGSASLGTLQSGIASQSLATGSNAGYGSLSLTVASSSPPAAGAAIALVTPSPGQPVYIPMVFGYDSASANTIYPMPTSYSIFTGALTIKAPIALTASHSWTIQYLLLGAF